MNSYSTEVVGGGGWLWIWASLGAALLAHFLAMKSRKGLTHDVITTYASLVYDVADIACQTQNDSTHCLVFAALKLWFSTSQTINQLKICYESYVCVCVRVCVWLRKSLFQPQGMIFQWLTGTVGGRSPGACSQVRPPRSQWWVGLLRPCARHRAWHVW